MVDIFEEAYRSIQVDETDYNSPDNETTYAQVRINIETLIKAGFYTGDEGTLTQDPPDDTTGVLTDSAGGYSVDEYNDCLTVMVDGNGRGNVYTIDDTTATTLVHTGDNLFSDQVRSGDAYMVFYNFMSPGTAHDHDGVNSAQVVLADNQVTQAKMTDNSIGQSEMRDNAVGTAELKASNGTITTTQPSSNQALPGGGYGFYPRTKISNGTSTVVGDLGTHGSTAYVTIMGLAHPEDVGHTATAIQYYVTASGEQHWVFILKDKAGKVLCTWEAHDHPSFGNRGMEQPFLDYDPAKHDILVITPSMKDVRDINLEVIPAMGGGYMTPKKLQDGVLDDPFRSRRDFMEVFMEKFDILEAQQTDYPLMPCTIGLPRIQDGEIVDDWRLKPAGTRVVPIKSVIVQPNYITPVKYKTKAIMTPTP